MFNDSDAWVILSPIEQNIKAKIEKYGTPLKNWDISICRGILTGCNEAFIITTEKKNQILASCKTSEEYRRTVEILRPILRGRDIKRYSYDWADLWLINTHNGIKEKGIPPINIEEYPAIKAHLDEYWDKISKRADKGDTPYNLRNCAYMEDFDKPKIVWADISTEPAFSALEPGFIINNTCYMITSAPMYILAILNSKLIKWFFPKIATDLGKGSRYFKQFVETIPLIKMSEAEQKILETFLKEKYEQKINKLVYDLYNLSEEEQCFIESNSY